MSDQFDPYHVWLGIPPEEQPPNHYRLLGLRPFEANPDVISNALDQRRAFLRSVQAGKRGAQSQQLLNEVSAAGVALLDSTKKSSYDDELKKKLLPKSTPAHTSNLPDPMAPLAIADLLPQQRPTSGPVVGNAPAPGTATVVAPTARTMPMVHSAPLIKTGRKTPPASSGLITAIVLVGAGLALAAIAGGVWWATSRNNSTAMATAPATASSPPSLPPTAPPELPPSLPPTAPITADPSATGPTPNPSRQVVTTTPAPNIPRTTPSAPQPPAANPQQPTPSQPASPSKPLSSGDRQPVPDSDALSKGEAQARQVYVNELKVATKPPQQAALAQQIINTGRTTQGDLTSRFVLIDLARTLFVQAGEVGEALTAARILEIEYDIPRDQLLTTTLEALDDAPMSLDQRLFLVKTAASLADTAADAEEFDRADKLSNLAVQSAAKLRDADLRKEVAQRRTHIVRLVKEWNALKPSLEKLKTDASDDAANLAAGKFYCFSLEDFHQGLTYLADSGDALLADAAKKDLAAQMGTSAQRLEAADAWHKAQLKIVDREDKLAAQRRERWLLQQAVTGLSGIDQIKATKRLGELQGISGPAAGRKTGEIPVMPAMPSKTTKKKATKSPT